MKSGSMVSFIPAGNWQFLLHLFISDSICPILMLQLLPQQILQKLTQELIFFCYCSFYLVLKTYFLCPWCKYYSLSASSLGLQFLIAAKLLQLPNTCCAEELLLLQQCMPITNYHLNYEVLKFFFSHQALTQDDIQFNAKFSLSRILKTNF